MKLYFSVHEHIAAWPLLDQFRRDVAALIASANLPVRVMPEMEVLPFPA